MGCACITVRPRDAPDRLPLSGGLNVAATFLALTQAG
jgi:hypothetical protein